MKDIFGCWKIERTFNLILAPDDLIYSGPLKYRSSIVVSAISGFIVVVRFLAAFSLAGETMPENFQLLLANDDLDFVSKEGVGCRTLGTSKKNGQFESQYTLACVADSLNRRYRILWNVRL